MNRYLYCLNCNLCSLTFLSVFDLYSVLLPSGPLPPRDSFQLTLHVTPRDLHGSPNPLNRVVVILSNDDFLPRQSSRNLTHVTLTVSRPWNCNRKQSGKVHLFPSAHIWPA